MKAKIVRRWLDSLKPKDGTERGKVYTDRDLPGFRVTVYSTGVIAFAVRYRVTGSGRRRNVKLGDHPALSPEDARKAALAVLGGAAKGEDEAAKREAARERETARSKRITFKTWRTDYVKDAARRLKHRTIGEVERFLALAGKEWDASKLNEITVKDVETFRNRLAEKGATQANRFLAHLNASFTAAVRLGYLEASPGARVPFLKENDPRTRVLDADEEKRFREAVAAESDPYIKTAFTLLLDCGARASEVLAAKRSDFHDLDGDSPTWTIPSPKANRPQGVPLLPQTAAIVEATPELDESPWLLPGRNAFVHRHDLREPWDRLRAAAKIGPDVHLHDLRRTFGLRVTRSQGIFAASKLLRHASSRVTESTYAPLNAQDLRGYAERTERARVLSFKKGKKAKKA